MSPDSYPPSVLYAPTPNLLLTHFSVKLQQDMAKYLNNDLLTAITDRQKIAHEKITTFVNSEISKLAEYTQNLVIAEKTKALEKEKEDNATNLVNREPSPLPLKSSLVKTKTGKARSSNDNSDSEEPQKKKKVVFSGKDEITIVPNIQDLREQYESETSEDDEEENNTSSLQTISNSLEQEQSPDDDDDLGEEIYNAGPSPQQFNSPLYSDSSYSSGLESMEASPVEIETHIHKWPAPETTSSSNSRESDAIQPRAVISSEITTENDVEHNESIETITYKDNELSSYSPTNVGPSNDSDQPSKLAVQLINHESQSSSDDDDDINFNDPSYDDDDEEEEMFQFDETLGVMPESTKTEEVDPYAFVSSSRNTVPYLNSLPSNFDFSLMAASLPTNKSRTGQDQIPTVVGSLRPRNNTKYKLSRSNGFKNGSASDNISPASSTASSAQTITSNDNTLINTNRFAKREISHSKGVNIGGSSSTIDTKPVSTFANSLPIQISHNASSGWGHLARNKPPIMEEEEESAHPVGSLVPDHKKSQKMLPLKNHDQVVTGSLVHSSADYINSVISDEDILMASPSSAAEMLNAHTLDPEQMSFSQRLHWERRSSRQEF